MIKLQIVLTLAASIVIAILVAATVPVDSDNDFKYFYGAGRAVLSGQNPYTDSGYFNPIHVALVAAPLSLVPFDLALRLNAVLAFIIYMVALYRLLGWRVLWVAMFAPFWIVITYWGNLDAWVLLGVTLPAPVGVWLLIAKPQIGLFAALIMLWRYRDWRLAAAVAGVGLVSLALGMIHGGLITAASVDLWPYGLIVGVPLPDVLARVTALPETGLA